MTQSFGIIGVGAFGALAARHLSPFFDLVLHDAAKDVAPLAQQIGARAGDLRAAASCDIVMLAVPVQKLRQVLADIANLLKPTALVVDVCSVKIKPVAAMLELLPPTVAIVGTHPLFGPQSGKNGIAGLNIAVCEARGGRGAEVARFCAEKLGLRVSQVTPEEHDREAAYVQGLTHMLAKIIVSLDLPDMRMPTRTYELMQQMVEMIRYDSDDLFRAIQRENPFSGEVKDAFFTAARKLEEDLVRE
ncbi:MAG: prephenate dehydrogenase/arogenate dehydrogenase family protein [Alphaproteobacteria bacterium]|nr:prephenate dehydrogenase/arogenate dehydrogenase family protein [Alphaproteobacteria bacterium]